MTKQSLTWFGGKFYLADWIISLMPRHLTYIEPYAGGLAVLMRKDPMDKRHQWGWRAQEKGKSEIVNDIHGGLTNFWKVLRDVDAFKRFVRIIEATPFCRQIWEESEALMMPDEGRTVNGCDVDAAVAFFIRCRQSRAANFRNFQPNSKNNTYNFRNAFANNWLCTIDNLPEVHERLRQVVILNENAVHVIKREDDWKTLFYLDPPYLHETRESTKVYKFEMSRDDHIELLETIEDCDAAVMISGYRSELYDDMLSKWIRHDKETTTGASNNNARRTESLWCNF